MRRTTIGLALVTAVLVLGIAPALAKKPVGTGKPSTVAKTHAPKTTTKTTKASTPKTSNGATMKASKSTTSKGKSSTAKMAKADSPKGKSKKSTSTTTADASTTSGSTETGSTEETTGGESGGTVTTVEYNSLAKKLSTKSNLLEKVKAAAGISSSLAGDDLITALNGATEGFKNFGQLIAAANVSNNHDVEFAELKVLMTGVDINGDPVTTTSGEAATKLSLGQALKQLGVEDADVTATQATTQANAEISGSTSTTSTKSKGKSKTKKKNTVSTTTPTGGSV
jgi:hypothetical protein